jgi:hypothetical protein
MIIVHRRFNGSGENNKYYSSVTRADPIEAIGLHLKKVDDNLQETSSGDLNFKGLWKPQRLFEC